MTCSVHKHGCSCKLVEVLKPCRIKVKKNTDHFCFLFVFTKEFQKMKWRHIQEGLRKDSCLSSFLILDKNWRQHCMDSSHWKKSLNSVCQTLSHYNMTLSMMWPSVESDVVCAAKQALAELPQHNNENPLGMQMEMNIIIAGNSVFALNMGLTYFPGLTAGMEQRRQLRKQYSAGLNWCFHTWCFFPPHTPAHFLHFIKSGHFIK